eukprot:scaffold31790_cov146-Isochrysis_galbana.AAC.1
MSLVDDGKVANNSPHSLSASCRSPSPSKRGSHRRTVVSTASRSQSSSGAISARGGGPTSGGSVLNTRMPSPSGSQVADCEDCRAFSRTFSLQSSWKTNSCMPLLCFVVA